MISLKGSQSMTRRNVLEVALHGLILLFFFQLVSDFVEAIYAFGLMGTSIPVEIVAILFLFSPLILLLLPGGLSGWPLVLVGELMFLCRVAETLLDTRGRMLVAGLGVACFLVLLPSILWNRRDREGTSSGLMLGASLTVALSLSILFRTPGSGSDVSTVGPSQAVGWILALAAGVLLLGPARPEPAPDRAASAARHERLSSWRTLGLCLGLAGVLILCYFAFASPHVMARWTGVSAIPIVSMAALVLGLFAVVLAARPSLLRALRPGVVLGWNLLFGLSLVLTILAHQVSFPAGAGAYPLPEPPVTAIHHVPLFLTLLLFPVIVVDWMLFVRELVAGRPSFRALGAGFGLAALYLLLMILAQVFTTVYDYIPVVGPFFRDRFWLVFLVAVAVMALPVLLVRRGALDVARTGGEYEPGRAFAVLAVLVAVATILGAAVVAARPGAPPSSQTSLRILTYNIQQGYNRDGLRDHDGQLALIRDVDADIIGLQESDTARIAGGNADVVKYLADRLDLHSYYGPKTVPGTFGIALLSKYPIENPRTFYMYSEGEQTATIEAQITVGGRSFNVFVTHLGNGGPMVQQEAILHRVRGKENVILMGDFNFRPDTEQYRMTTGLLDDSWLQRWPGGNEGQGIDPARRIDHIFVSPGTKVVDSEYLPGPQSDHPAMTTIIEW